MSLDLNQIFNLFSDCVVMSQKNQVYDLLIQQIEEMGESISLSKDKGEWHVHGNDWDVSAKSFPMVIAQAYMKWAESKNNLLKEEG